MARTRTPGFWLGIIAVVLALGGFAVAAIPGPNGTINGCYAKNNGALRVIPAGKKCRKSELAIAFNQKGDRGAQGLAGEAGAPGGAGPKGEAGAPGGAGPKGEAGAPGGAGPKGEAGAAGATGLSGPTGATGSAGQGFTFQGAYDGGISYLAYDVVAFEGSSYVARVDNPSGEPTGKEGSDWSLMAAKGAEGAPGAPGPSGSGTGTTGPTGPTGATGPKGNTGEQGPAGTAAAGSTLDPYAQVVGTATLLSTTQGGGDVTIPITGATFHQEAVCPKFDATTANCSESNARSLQIVHRTDEQSPALLRLFASRRTLTVEIRLTPPGTDPNSTDPLNQYLAFRSSNDVRIEKLEAAAPGGEGRALDTLSFSNTGTDTSLRPVWFAAEAAEPASGLTPVGRVRFEGANAPFAGDVPLYEFSVAAENKLSGNQYLSHPLGANLLIADTRHAQALSDALKAGSPIGSTTVELYLTGTTVIRHRYVLENSFVSSLDIEAGKYEVAEAPDRFTPQAPAESLLRLKLPFNQLKQGHTPFSSFTCWDATAQSTTCPTPAPTP